MFILVDDNECLTDNGGCAQKAAIIVTQKAAIIVTVLQDTDWDLIDMNVQVFMQLHSIYSFYYMVTTKHTVYRETSNQFCALA